MTTTKPGVYLLIHPPWETIIRDMWGLERLVSTPFRHFAPQELADLLGES